MAKKIKPKDLQKVEEKKEVPPEPELQVDDLNIVIIDGIDKQISTKLKRMKIKTVREFVNADVTVMQEKTKMPLNKVIELQKKAIMMLDLEFDEDIVDLLAAKDYTIEQAIEEDPKVLMKITSREMEQLSEFREDLKQITIYLDVKTCREMPISIVPHAKKEIGKVEPEPDDQFMASLLWYVELALIVLFVAMVVTTLVSAGVLL